MMPSLATTDAECAKLQRQREALEAGIRYAEDVLIRKYELTTEHRACSGPINARNFTRLIKCLESDWAQTQPGTALQLAKRMAERDGAHDTRCWLGLGPDFSGDVYRIIRGNCPSRHDIRDRYRRIAAALRLWCDEHEISLEEAA